MLLKFNVIDDGPIYEDDHITVTAIRTKHCRTRGREEGDPCSFAFVIDFKKREEKNFAYGRFKPQSYGLP